MNIYVKNFLFDLIFPRFCIGCQKELELKEVSFICEACFNKIPLNTITCHICGLRNNNGACRRCRRYTNLSGVFSAGKYENSVLREAIHRFKYQSVKSLKKPLAELLVNFLEKENLKIRLSNSTLVPIPLTWRRKLKRGFNQSEILAKEISIVLNCPVINLIKRKKFSAPQAKIEDWQKRKENISDAFCLNPKILMPGTDIAKIILVDDVATSGATLEEAAKILKQAGVKEIYGLVIAKG